MLAVLLAGYPPHSMTNTITRGGTVLCEEGERHLHNGKTVKYTMCLPEPRPKRMGVVLLVHGFSRDRTSHLHTAEDFAAQGLIAFAPDMVSLLRGSSAQLDNIEGVASHALWLRARNEDPQDPLHGCIDSSRLALVGHSAGGAVCLEAACRLQAEGFAVAALVLLDAVPWARTLEEVPQQLSPLPLLSIRCEPSSWNLNGLIGKVLQQLAFEHVDLRVVGARHIDPENPLHDHWFRNKVKYWVGVMGTSDHQESVQLLLQSFLVAVLQPKAGDAPRFAEVSERLQTAGKVVPAKA